MLRLRLAAADPRDLGRGGVARRPRARGGATATGSPPSPPRPTTRRRRDRDPARTFAGSTASTRSWRCVSPSAVTPRSPSTTSAEPPVSRSATTTSSTCRTSQQTTRKASRRTSPPRSRGSVRPARSLDLHRRLLLRRPPLLARGGGGHGLAGAVGFYGRPGAGRDGSPGPTQRAAELEAPILALMGGADEGIPVDVERSSSARSRTRVSSTRS